MRVYEGPRQTTAPVTVPVRLKQASRWAIGPGLLAIGIALLLVGTIILDRETAWPRWTLGLLGCVAMFKGLDAVGVRIFGPRFKVGFWLSVAWLALLLLLAIIAPILPLQSPKALPLTAKGWIRPDLFSGHALGTDDFGRDELSRIIYGARISLFIGVGCALVGGLLGSLIGVVAGYFRGPLDRGVNTLTDSLLAFPPLVFLLALVAVLRPSLHTEFIALSALTVPAFIRLARANTFVYAEREFVHAARALGATNRRIIIREILPSVLRPLMSYFTVIVAALIVAEASLSYLGLGIQPPDPSWGNMINQAQTVLQQDPHGVLVPAVVLCITVIAFNRLGEGARSRQPKGGALL